MLNRKQKKNFEKSWTFFCGRLSRPPDRRRSQPAKWESSANKLYTHKFQQKLCSAERPGTRGTQHHKIKAGLQALIFYLTPREHWQKLHCYCFFFSPDHRELCLRLNIGLPCLCRPCWDDQRSEIIWCSVKFRCFILFWVQGLLLAVWQTFKCFGIFFSCLVKD